MRVLVADDDISVRRLVERQLSNSTHEVTLAVDGSDAWRCLQAGEVHVAVLDWNMPGVDGVEICRRLQESRSAVYPIILTATDDAGSLATALDAGASDYIVKPWHASALLARVNVGARIIRMQTRLAESQKLESMGHLAAGIAHEINTPIQFVGNNIRFLSDSISDLLDLVRTYREMVSQCDRGAEEAAKLEERADLAYMECEIPQAIEQSLEGVDRVSRIVGAMKDFSHSGVDNLSTIDLNRAIESAITVARNEWKYVAEIVTDFDQGLPLLPCLPGELNQVILNLIVNAAHAIGDRLGRNSGNKGTITILTKECGEWAELRISDTGIGIPEENRTKVFDCFFTTKEVGKATGQGLAIAHSVITNRHRGSIRFESEVGTGTTFIVRLPLLTQPVDIQETSRHEEACPIR